MRVRVQIMIQDPLTSRHKEMQPTEEYTIDSEDFFLDGPITQRVAVLNFDRKSGELLPGVPFQPPKNDQDSGYYRMGKDSNIYADDFKIVSVFGTVLRTMSIFEEADTLGRPLTWAFGAPQLLVIPHAGRWANAYYERESHSLQFFYFPINEYSDEMIYTSLSRDIVSHETGHAILDGIAPDLYHSITPQSLALHEAIADLTALMSAFRSDKLRDTVLQQTGGSIANSTAFSSIAEEFGRTLNKEGHASYYLRSLLNHKTLDPNDISRDERNEPNLVPRDDPHVLSEVLTGALYSVMVKIHERLKREEAIRMNRNEYQVSGRALFIGASRFQRMVFRALDYLPPGEISFADYGRAIIASDQASHPDAEREREWIRDEFVSRQMVPDRAALDVDTSGQSPECRALNEALRDIDLALLCESDWVAYEFANRNREALGIPHNIPFQVRPRLDVTKLYYVREGKKKIRECIMKVSWSRTEDNPLGRRFPAKRQITVGTMIAIDWDTKSVRAKLTSDLGRQPQQDRDQMLQRLVGLGLLQPERQAVGPDGRELRSVVVAEASAGIMRVRGSGRMLHIIGEV